MQDSKFQQIREWIFDTAINEDSTIYIILQQILYHSYYYVHYI